MKKLLILALFAAVTFCAAAQELTVATYNIRNANRGDAERGNGWERRGPWVCRLIEFHGFDIFGSQEVLDGQLHDMLAQLPDYDYIGVGRDDGKTQGEYAPVFYKKEGFCWNNLLNPNARLLKVKLKGESVNDVGSMSLYAIDLLSNKFIVALLNSNVLFDYYREFINCSVNIQVNDIKQLPIIIPTKEFAFLIESLADKAIKKKQKLVDNDLEFIEEEIEDLIKTLYSI